MNAIPADRPLRTVKSFVRRQSRITNRQERALTEFWPRFGIDFRDEQLDLDQVFGRNAPRNLEIGFGKGEALIAMAEQFSAEDFIGIEVFSPGVGHVLSELAISNFSNVRVMQHDAIDIIEKQIGVSSIDNVYLFFPDPWHKKRHHKRRIVNEKFLTLLAKILRTNGHLYMATDWENYAEHMMGMLSEFTAFRNAVGEKQFAQRNPRRPLTKFERRGQLLGHGVWDLDFIRVD